MNKFVNLLKDTKTILLIIIAIGVYILIYQNTQTKGVYVKYVNGGYVNIRGSVNVDNTVSVSIDEVLGKDDKKYYYNNR